MTSPLQRVLDQQGFAVLDGGLATELEARGHVLDSELWSAKMLVDAPEAIRDVHLAFLAAGADCITTASYQASLAGFVHLGLDAAEGERLLRRSVEVALAARDAFRSDPASRAGRVEPLVAASVGPYGAYLADGSEYEGRYVRDGDPTAGSGGGGAGGVSRWELAEFHRPRLRVLADAGPDLLALETIPSLPEVEVLVELLAEVRHPGAWISFSCRDGARLRDGSPVEEAVRSCDPAAGVVAVGVNCTAPDHVASLVQRMRRATDLPILAYPNSGEAYDSRTGRWTGRPAGAGWLEQVPEWVQAGAHAVGGCCRVGPETIAGVRRTMEISWRKP
ncbi:MAG TPA: homocysteine S-methyltransferase [Longimicrobiales bacterium]|nr:homocysteine S-methyltransferase [Longimicrobiales bacterium]